MIALELDYSNFGSHDVLYRLDQSGIFFSPNSPYVLSSRNKSDGITLNVVQ